MLGRQILQMFVLKKANVFRGASALDETMIADVC